MCRKTRHKNLEPITIFNTDQSLYWALSRKKQTLSFQIVLSTDRADEERTDAKVQAELKKLSLRREKKLRADYVDMCTESDESVDF